MTEKPKTYGWVNLHRHAEYSTFDGFGKNKHAAEHAANMGQKALGLTDHGVVNGLIEHYLACRENKINPILGSEVYFQPTFNQDKPSYHMCLFAKDMTGYKNLMKIITEANADCFYRKAIVTLDNLRKHNEGIICSTACIGGWPSQAIMKGKHDLARKRMAKLHKIFKDDFYVELMPYHVVENGVDLQYKVDCGLLEIIDECGYKGIITTDSHYIKREDYDSFQMVFKISGKQFDNDYSQRYMPSEREVASRFKKMYKRNPIPFLKNTAEIASKCHVSLEFEEKIPKIDFGEESDRMLRRLTREGLKSKGKWDQEHWDQAREELVVIGGLGFEDYFLMCWDIVKFARDNKIQYGHGRGSVCGSVVAYALNITSVDPLELDTVFERFLRPDKKSLPDIDLDFERDRRQEVIEYVYRRFEGRAALAATYGYYKVNNLTNDLCKVLEIPKEENEQIKQVLNQLYPELIHGTDVSYVDIMKNAFMKKIEMKYGFVKHFAKMCGQIRYIGKHAGGVAITYGEFTDYFAVIKAAGKLQCCYDLTNLGYLKVLKMDILGVNTLNVIADLESMTGHEFSEDMYKDADVMEHFKNGDTTAIFQFDKPQAKGILVQIEADNIQDVIAASSINRPAPLSMGIPKKFAEAKLEGHDETALASSYIPATYGCFIYQEDIIKIGRGLSDMPWKDIDMIMKGLKNVTGSTVTVRKSFESIKQNFISSALRKHPELKKRKPEVVELFELMTGGYLFNKGHAAGYALVAAQQMWYKHYFPLEFWCATLRHEDDEFKRKAYEVQAAHDGCIFLPAHINGTSNYEIVEFGGGLCIQRGLKHVKNIGPKAADDIEAHKPYLDKPDFEDRTTKRVVNARVVRVLEEIGAFEFNAKRKVNAVKRLNRQLITSNMQVR